MIFIHKNLQAQNPKLYEKAIEHEMKHSASYKFKDLFLDLRPEGTFFPSIMFMVKNPKSLKQFLPVFIWEGHVYIDYTLAFLYALLILIVVVMV